MMNIEIIKTKELLAAQFIKYLRIAVEEKTGDFYLALSGGSTPDSVFKLLREEGNCAWMDKVKVFWCDERCVPYNHEDSNFGRANKLFFSPCEMNYSRIYPVPFLVSEIQAAAEYSNTLLQNVPLYNGVPQFDMVVLGLGEDGHTASIFPNAIELWDSEKCCEVAVHPVSKQKRVTLTGKVINNSKQVCFLVVGENKSKILRNLNDNSQIYPASKVNPHSGKLLWMVDLGAASAL